MNDFIAQEKKYLSEHFPPYVLELHMSGVSDDNLFLMQHLIANISDDKSVTEFRNLIHEWLTRQITIESSEESKNCH